MGRGQFGPVVHQFRHLFEGRSIAGASEWQLLHRYLDGRDEVAFEAIVARHGPMVLGVCRRLLADGRDVEDAFQATFVILAEKGRTLGEHDPVGHWLYGVARRVALRARASAARRLRLERSAEAPESALPVDDLSGRDLASVVDQELARLPDRYRAPVVLCYLEGRTHEEAARQLGWPLGTVKGRLARARDLLKGRLSRRGVAPAGWLALIRGSRSAVPRSLVELTKRVATAGRSAGTVPAGVASLAAGSLWTMILINKLKAAGFVVVTLVLGTGAAVMAYQVTRSPGPVKVMPAVLAQSAAPEADDVGDWAAGWPELTNPPEPDAKTRAILKKLDEAISMNFPNDTPLEDVKKYIQAATQDEAAGLPIGIPIYVDPIGLQNADKTMANTIVMSLEGIPLKTTLRLLLKQLSLQYVVKDGLMTITSTAEDDTETPFDIMQEKARRGELTRQQYRQLVEALKLKRQVEALVTTEVEKSEGLNAGGGGPARGVGGGFR